MQVKEVKISKKQIDMEEMHQVGKLHQDLVDIAK